MSGLLEAWTMDRVILSPKTAADALNAAAPRIGDLLEANNRYIQAGRDARAKVRELEGQIGIILASLTRAVEIGEEYKAKSDGLASDLASALDVLIRRINGEADLANAAGWVRLNYPKLADQISPAPPATIDPAVLDRVIDAIEEELIEAEVDYPGGRQAGLNIVFDDGRMREAITKAISLEWPIDAPQMPEPDDGMAVFQQRVAAWCVECFGETTAKDTTERNYRFLEEAIELVQANGCTLIEAMQLVLYVFGRDQGEINQEVGGVMVTLAALIAAAGGSISASAIAEIERIERPEIMEKIRRKHAAKPHASPLPGDYKHAAPLPQSQTTPIAAGSSVTITGGPASGEDMIALAYGDDDGA